MVSIYGNEIWVAEGTYKPGSCRCSTFYLFNGVGIYGGFDPGNGYDLWSERDYVNNLTILSGDIGTVDINTDNSYHVVYSSGCDSNSIIDGFTITRGYADYYGGGMYNYGSSPSVTNCTFTYNSGNHGGGMCNGSSFEYYVPSNPTVTNCVFNMNSASNGGGMYNDLNCSVTISNCIFSDNTSVGPNWGGGICNYFYSSVTITDCVFSNNSAGWGGAIHSGGSNVLSNCVFVGNSVTQHGGAIFNNIGDLKMTNCTVTGNSATYDGGGLCIAAEPTQIDNCIIWNNNGRYGDEIFNIPGSDGANIAYCNIKNSGGSGGGWDPNVGNDGGGNIDVDPNFVDPNDADGDDDIWMTSDDGLVITNTRCIDAANGNVDPNTDILGNSRDDDPNWSNIGIGEPNYVDMGAYEHQV